MSCTQLITLYVIFICLFAVTETKLNFDEQGLNNFIYSLKFSMEPIPFREPTDDFEHVIVDSNQIKHLCKMDSLRDFAISKYKDFDLYFNTSKSESEKTVSPATDSGLISQFLGQFSDFMNNISGSPSSLKTLDGVIDQNYLVDLLSQLSSTCIIGQLTTSKVIYVVCPYSHVVRVFYSGDMIEKVENLGTFDRDFEWMSSDLMRNSNNFFGQKLSLGSHRQFYTNGSRCKGDKQISTQIKYICRAKPPNYSNFISNSDSRASLFSSIVSINQLSDCEFEIEVATNVLCSIPVLSANSHHRETHTITCHPTLDEEDMKNFNQTLLTFDKFIQKLQENRLVNDLYKLEFHKINFNGIKLDSDPFRDIIRRTKFVLNHIDQETTIISETSGSIKKADFEIKKILTEQLKFIYDKKYRNLVINSTVKKILLQKDYNALKSTFLVGSNIKQNIFDMTRRLFRDFNISHDITDDFLEDVYKKMIEINNLTELKEIIVDYDSFKHYMTLPTSLINFSHILLNHRFDIPASYESIKFRNSNLNLSNNFYFHDVSQPTSEVAFIDENSVWSNQTGQITRNNIDNNDYFGFDTQTVQSETYKNIYNSETQINNSTKSARFNYSNQNHQSSPSNSKDEL